MGEKDRPFFRKVCVFDVSQAVRIPRFESVSKSHDRMSGPEKGVITKGIFSLEESLESLQSLNALESLENDWILLCFPESGDSLNSLESLNSLKSLENGLFWKDPFSKRPLFPNPTMPLGFRTHPSIRDVPAKFFVMSRLKRLVLPGFKGGDDLFERYPFMWKIPAGRKVSWRRKKDQCLCSFSGNGFCRNPRGIFLNKFPGEFWRGFFQEKALKCRNPRGIFSYEFPVEFCGGIFLVDFIGPFSLETNRKKNPPQHPQQNSNQNLGVSRPKFTLR